MKKILFVSTYLARNGTEAFMMNVFRNIDKTKCHIDFLIFSKKKYDYITEIEEAGSKVFVLPNRRSGIKYFISLNLFFKNHHYDVLHWCACSCTSIAPLFFAFCHKVPKRIIHSHNSSVLGRHNIILHKLLCPIANVLLTDRIACSEKASKWFFGNRKSLILTNGIHLNSFIYNKEVRFETRKTMGFSLDEIILGNVGRFDPVKNHSKLIDIFYEFQKRESKARLMLVGIGSLEGIIKQKVQNLRIEDKVYFLGERNDVNILLQAMDCFVMPSIFEGLPFVLVEAQSAGLPCVVSNTVDEKVKITKDLFFVDLNESNSDWAHHIKDAIKKERKDTSNEIINAGFSIEQTVDSLMILYGL